MIEHSITVYGTWWCGDCTRVLRFFAHYHIPYQWVDIDRDEKGEKFVLATNKGMRSVPTIVFEDGVILVEPSETQLKQAMGIGTPPA